jgi:5-methylcytosine-specific restriction protein A
MAPPPTPCVQTASIPLQLIVTRLGPDMWKDNYLTARPTRTKAGGWAAASALERGPSGRPLCRWCRAEVPRGRRTFCSDSCVHEWKLRTDPAYLREKVFARDRGVCAKCGVDTITLRRDMRKLDFAARRRFLKQWKLREGSRKSLWDADHIVPVVEGGGQCDLSNMRTLCLLCHGEVTAALRERLRSGAGVFTS